MEAKNNQNPRCVCVFCASSSQVHPHFFEQAHLLGKILATEKIQLAYGAGNAGLMGELANAALQYDGEIIGVIPQFMIDEGWHHRQLKRMIVTDTMHERKNKVIELSDAIVILPGGVGTFDELFEAITLKQLGIINQPIVIVNIDGYFDCALKMLDQMIEQHFMLEIHRKIWVVVNDVTEVLEAIRTAPKWDKSVRKIAAI